MILFALTIFCGAFLLFQVQPLIGKFILPWFGGSPAVWTTCMLFFQILLLGGYAYAHLLSRSLRPRRQAMVHGVVLAAALLFLPVIPSVRWKTAWDQPTWAILELLLVTLGLPYLVLSATGPLLQDWFRRLYPGRSPYRLYALSNLGSFLALLTYPILFEPIFSRQTQAYLWSGSLAGFAVLCGLCAFRLWRSPESAQSAAVSNGGQSANPPAPTFGMRLLWFALPACAAVLLLAVTNKICQDVAVIPFLWILPLGLYLLSFVICFDSPGFYSRKVYGVSFAVAVLLLCDVLFEGVSFPILLQVGIYAATLFICCMICHGELCRLKPHPHYLTSFYLTLAAGGAAGGFFVAVIAPGIFRSYAELHWGLWLTALLLVLAATREQKELRVGQLALPIWRVGLAAVVVLGVVLRMQAVNLSRKAIYSTRNFYGVLRLFERDKKRPLEHRLILQSGAVLHGLQYVSPARAQVPTSYYSPQSGVGVALGALKRPGGRRIGVVGLGAGTLAAYGQPGDSIRYYEINPAVKRIAETRFTFLANSTARVDVVMGDARLSLEQELPQHFDLLVLDAFTSDAIPVHLLTLEAFQIYQRHLKPDGILAVHISNHHLDLWPVVEKLSRAFDLRSRLIAEKGRGLGSVPSEWALLTRDASFFEQQEIRQAITPRADRRQGASLWTDDYTSVFKILK